MRTHEETHVSSVFVRADFETVWERITDPMNFPELYPAWTTDVERIGEGVYRGTEPAGDAFVIRPRLDPDYGIVDFDVEANGSVERSRPRLFDVDEGSCVLVHLAARWDGVDDRYWEEHKRGTDEDLARMKQLVETGSHEWRRTTETTDGTEWGCRRRRTRTK